MKSKKRYSLQYSAYLIHSFIGLKLYFILTLVVVTGTFATFAQELDWLLYKQIQVTPQEPAQRVNVGTLIDHFNSTYPHANSYYLKTHINQPWKASQISFDRKNGSWANAWYNPYTGNFQGETGYFTPGQFLAGLHSTLFIPEIGRPVVNFLGLILLISVVSGLCALPKFWRHFLIKPRKQHIRVFLLDLHKLAGLWSLWISLIMALTSCYWFYLNPLVSDFSAPNPIQIKQEAPSLNLHIGDTLIPIPHENLISEVLDRYPEILITIIETPQNPHEPLRIISSSKHWLVSDWNNNQIYQNPFTTEIIASNTVDDQSVGQRIISALEPLHYGTWSSGASGYLVKTCYFLGGMMLSFIAISGTLIQYQRCSGKLKKLSKRKQQDRSSSKFWQTINKGAPLLKPIHIPLIIIIIWGCLVEIDLASGKSNADARFSENVPSFTHQNSGKHLHESSTK